MRSILIFALRHFNIKHCHFYILESLKVLLLLKKQTFEVLVAHTKKEKRNEKGTKKKLFSAIKKQALFSTYMRKDTTIYF